MFILVNINLELKSALRTKYSFCRTLLYLVREGKGHQNIKTFLLGHLTVSALHQNQHKVQRSLFVLQSFAIRTTIWADPKRDHHKILIPNNRVYLHKHVIATSFKFRIGKYSRIFLWCSCQCWSSQGFL